MHAKPRRIAINGFGRIGRRLANILLDDERFVLAAINDPADAATMAHLFKYDSVHGRSKHQIRVVDNGLEINGNFIYYTSEKDPAKLPWAQFEIDTVVECSGVFKKRKELESHIQAGAKKVLLSVPPEDDLIRTIVLGVNEKEIHAEDKILSNASCTTNNAAPMIKVLDGLCGIESCYITTVHSYTTDQRLHDAPHKDLRRSRAAALSIIPTTTGAAKALTKVFPHLASKMGGCGMRVPVPDGSLTDITCMVKRNVSIAEINAAFERAANEELRGILEYTTDPIVSADVVGNPHSCVFDAQLTSVIGSMVKVVGWYDNEHGYSSRLHDLLLRW
jgi:glyceraldehyde 3-phosphate dehydrogenase